MWLHHLLNPHCSECEARARCEVCEELRSILASEKREKQLLLDALMSYTKKEIIEPLKTQPEMMEPIRPTTWRMRQQMLEEQDRVKAAILKKQEMEMKTTDELEKELLENNAN
jgi:hypothetical protein